MEVLLRRTAANSTCLMATAFTGAALLLLATTAQGQQGSTKSIYDAARTGDVATLNALIAANPALVNAKNSIHRTALFDAAAYGKVDAVKLLLSKGAAVNFDVHPDAEGDDPGCTPLLLAAENGHLEVARLLLDKGANVNAKASYNTIHQTATPLIGATEVAEDFEKLGGGPLPGSREAATKKHGYLELVKLLLDKGADVSAKNNFGNTALLIASGNGQAEVVKLLLDRGAAVNLGNNQNVTPLLMAAQYGDVDVITALLAKGANPNAAMTGSKPWTPITVAEANHFTNVVEILRKAALATPK